MKRNKVEQVRTLLERNPRMKTADVMKAIGATKSYTYVLMSKARASFCIPLFSDSKVNRSTTRQ